MARLDVAVCDGLWNHLSTADELRSFIRAQKSRCSSPALVDRANDGGGYDNITAVLARVGGANPSVPADRWRARMDERRCGAAAGRAV